MYVDSKTLTFAQNKLDLRPHAVARCFVSVQEQQLSAVCEGGAAVLWCPADESYKGAARDFLFSGNKEKRPVFTALSAHHCSRNANTAITAQPSTTAVVVTATSLLWRESTTAEVFTYQGLTSCTKPDQTWTIMGSMWHFLRKRTGRLDGDLSGFVHSEAAYQDKLETTGYRPPSWRGLRALQGIQKATQLQGGSAVLQCAQYVSAATQHPCRAAAHYPPCTRPPDQCIGQCIRDCCKKNTYCTLICADAHPLGRPRRRRPHGGLT